MADREPKWADVEEATKVRMESDKVAKVGKDLHEGDAVDTSFFILDDGILEITTHLEEERNGDYLLSEVLEGRG